MEGGLTLAAQGQRDELVDVQVFNRDLVAILGRIGNDGLAVGRHLEVGEARESQQIAIIGAIELGPHGTVIREVMMEGLDLERPLWPHRLGRVVDHSPVIQARFRRKKLIIACSEGNRLGWSR